MVNKSFYIPDTVNIKSFDEDLYADEDLYERKSDGLFHVGQSYEDKPADTVYCKHCGGNDFNVGVGSYFTAIKCKKCNWEACIHDG